MSLIGISLTNFYLQNIHPCYLHLAAHHTLPGPPCVFQRLYYVLVGLPETSLASSAANYPEDMQGDYL